MERQLHAGSKRGYLHQLIAGAVWTSLFALPVIRQRTLILAGEDPETFRNPNYVRSRPVLNDIRSWYAGFFGSSPREATLADPQQKLFAECVWEVLEAAGYATQEGRGVVGVYAALMK